MSDSRYKSIRRTVMGLLKYKTEKLYEMNLSTEELQKTVAKENEKIYQEREGFDLQENYLDRLISDISTKFGIKEENEIKTFSSNEVDHIEWDTEEIQESIDNHPAWTSYYDYFAEKYPLSVLNDLKRNSSRILFKLEDPKREGKWSSKGLVIGEVQSGKTMNMLALVNRAIGAGYRFVIVLTGLSEILRIQTQKRFDEGVVGRLSASDNFYENYGVSSCRDPEEVLIRSITKSSFRSDFKSLDVDTNIQPSSKEETIILVVKKNTKILENIKNNLDRWNNKNPIDKLPLLLIDDECDNASVNTAGEDPSRTNKLIREILNKFNRSCYVGFTATAYANIFIDHQFEDENLGRDLFPDHISFLPVYNNYQSYRTMFPDEEDDDSDYKYMEKVDDFVTKKDLELLNQWYRGDIKRKVLEQELEFSNAWLPPTHDKSWKLNNDASNKELPQSLKNAIHHFIIACAVKKIRKIDNEISSMLIHVSLYNNIHTQLVEHINFYLNKFREKNFSTYEKVENDLKEYFEKKVKDNLYLDYNPHQEPIEWAEIKNLLGRTISNIDIIPMNNEYDAAHKTKTKEKKEEKLINIHKKLKGGDPEIASQIQSYANAIENGYDCICIGGNQLARGLTLEGLTVNYFLRDQTTGNNDTMTQMGRWFGYRDNYDDLCILFTSQNLIGKFRKFYSQKENFMRQIMNLDTGKYTPRQIGMYIVMYAGVNPTAKNKMRNGEEISVKLIFDADHIQELNIPTTARDKNEKVIESLFNKIEDINISGKLFDNRKWMIWDDVPAEIILDEFIDKYNETEGQISDSSSLGEQKTYIRELNKYGELTNWTVGFYLGGSVANTISHFNIKEKEIEFNAMQRSRRYGPVSEGDNEKWDGRIKSLENDEHGTYEAGSLTDLKSEKVDLLFRHELADVKANTELAKFNQLVANDDSEKPKIRSHLRKSRDPKRCFLMIFPVFPKKTNDFGKNLKPYFAYATSYPESKFLHDKPENIEKIFGPQRKIVNTVGIEKAKRAKYQID